MDETLIQSLDSIASSLRRINLTLLALAALQLAAVVALVLR